jgi:[ribosomal protein S5]-alanine N-acetyltransferase
MGAFPIRRLSIRVPVGPSPGQRSQSRTPAPYASPGKANLCESNTALARRLKSHHVTTKLGHIARTATLGKRLITVGRIHGWPTTLTEPNLLDAPVVLRPVRVSDVRTRREIQEANASWLSPLKGTSPEATPPSRLGRYGSWARRSPIWPYVSMARRRLEGRRGIALAWTVGYDGQFAGEVTVWRISWGSNRSAELGYWIDERLAGRGIMPTALAMAVDHCFLEMGLHRLVASIQPENAASRRVVEKLGFRDEGVRVREVHIDGAWRDHVCYAITAEEAPGGILPRWRSSLAGADPAPHALAAAKNDVHRGLSQ